MIRTFAAAILIATIGATAAFAADAPRWITLIRASGATPQ